MEPTDLAHRFEGWLVSYLDDEDPPEVAANWQELLEAGTLIKRGGTNNRHTPKRKLQRMWSRLSVVRKRSITLVKVLDQSLVKEDVVLDVATEMHDVVRAGADRIVLDFSNVERMSAESWGSWSRSMGAASWTIGVSCVAA